MEAAQETVSIVMEAEQATRAKDKAVGQDEENMNDFMDFDDKDDEQAMQLMSFQTIHRDECAHWVMAAKRHTHEGILAVEARKRH
jgi:hypothetical protein